MGKFDLYVGRSVLFATLGVLVLLVGLDALTSDTYSAKDTDSEFTGVVF